MSLINIHYLIFLQIMLYMFRVLIGTINSLQRPANAVGCINIILLHCNHRHVSAVHVAVFRFVRARIQIILCFRMY